MHTPQMLRNMTFEELEQYSKTFDDVPQEVVRELLLKINHKQYCLLYTSPSPRD